MLLMLFVVGSSCIFSHGIIEYSVIDFVKCLLDWWINRNNL